MLRARTANGGGPGASKVDASWILGPENVKKGQAAAGVDSGMDGLMVFCWKITPDLAPRMLWGGVVMSSGSCSHGDGSK